MADTTDLTYTPTTWADGADGGTAITAARLNNIEQGVSAATTQVNANTKSIKALGDSVSQALGGKRLIQDSFMVSVPNGTTKATVVRDSVVVAAWASPQTSNVGLVEATAQWTDAGLTIYVHSAVSGTWSGSVTWFALV
jgi:hypothetical protein